MPHCRNKQAVIPAIFKRACPITSGESILFFFFVTLFLLFLFAEIVSSKATEYRRVIFPNGVHIKAEVADTRVLRERGLMFREKLSEDSGMLFVFSKAAPHRFWMKNVKMPLDMIWLDSTKQIIDILDNVPPCLIDPCADFGPEGHAAFVIETAGGFAKKNRLARGMRVTFDP